MEYEHITHSFKPVYDENSRILILGTLPSVKSRENNFYYGHKQNRFWKLLAYLLDEPVPQTIDEKKYMLLSKEFGVSINELISGERLWAEDFKKAADDNLVTALNNSTFTLKEKIVFFKKKWLHEHISTIVLCVVAWIGIIIWTALKLRGSDSYALLGAIGSMLAILFYVVLYNRMMVYVENHAYRATPDKETETKN